MECAQVMWKIIVKLCSHMIKKQPTEPHQMAALPVKKILMIKAHSMGIGDLLRSSAAWRALKEQWPEAELHLLFLSKHPGYAVEELIKNHHLLTSATFLTLREGSPHISGAKKVPYRVLNAKVRELSRRINPDLIIDFEPSGLRTTLLTRSAAKVCSAKTLGIAQFPGRGLFYDYSAPNTAAYARSQGLTLPMDYTNRDFVVLQALGINRNGRPIELSLSSIAHQYAQQLRLKLPKDLPVIGLNIGCGTPDAVHRRPKIIDLVHCVGAAVQGFPHSLVLTGAAFERDVNQEFMAAYAARWGDISHIHDLAGETNMDSLCGLIAACNLFISTDSGPYHMAVALKIPTIVWFTYPELTAFHDHPWCKSLLKPTPEEFSSALTMLLGLKPQ
jgi:ADP-heptose:LPS heptosyltransferase